MCGRPGERRELAHHVVIAGAERAAGDHLGDDEAGAVARGEPPHRPVGDARHRREEGPVADRLAADAQAAGRITHQMPHSLRNCGKCPNNSQNRLGAQQGYAAAPRALAERTMRR